jgi:hypothetical protein
LNELAKVMEMSAKAGLDDATHLGGVLAGLVERLVEDVGESMSLHFAATRAYSGPF